MAEAGAHKSALGWPGIALIIAMMGNLLWLRDPLKSSRPAEKEHLRTDLASGPKVEARLWQDPFEAVEAAPDDLGKVEPSGTNTPLANLCAQIRRRIEQHNGPPGKGVIILPVMVTGSPYSEGAEWRIRSRYAVLSGLSQSRGAAGERYVTVDREHLRFFRIEIPPRSAKGKNSQSPSEAAPHLTVPYEWLERHAPGAHTNKESVLVLWLREEHFEAHPLRNLSTLVHMLRDGVREAKGAEEGAAPMTRAYTDASMPTRIIGPWGSTTLRQMLRECEKEGFRESALSAFTNVTLFSASATAADWRLSPVLGTTNRPRTGVEKDLGDTGMVVTNVTCTDDQMALSLIAELELRGVSPTQGSRIALLSEWDTFYGRALPQAFVFAATNQQPDEAIARATNSIRVFSYLRGLDGTVAHGDAANAGGPARKSGKKTGTGTAGQIDISELERPEGTSQLDYARRLASRMSRIETQMAGLTNVHDRYAGDFRAIGVLGSDVYDKLLLVQALRKRFPEAIFFTTDLDARLMHPSQLRWTRTMIVASSFGLRLRDDLQGDIPPFRDTYQTAYFLAAQAAVDNYRLLPFDLEPQVFEIGQKRAYNLSAPRKESGKSNGIHPRPLCRLRPGICATLESVTERDGFGRTVLFISVFLVAAIIYVAELCGGHWRLDYGQTRVLLAVLFALIALGSATWLGKTAWQSNATGRGEPFTLTGGISIWPTEFVRLGAILLAVWFLMKELLAPRVVRARLERAYLGKEKEQKHARGPMRDFWHASRTLHSQIMQWLWKERTPPDAGKLRTWIRKRVSDPIGFLKTLARHINTAWTRLRRSVSIPRWRLETDRKAEACWGNDTIPAEPILRRYLALGGWFRRMFRIVPAVLGFIGIVQLLMLIFGFPVTPYRGTESSAIYQCMVLTSVGLMLLCLFYLMDATRLCSALIHLIAKPTGWANARGIHKSGRDMDTRCDSALDNWIDVRVMADCTHRAGSLIQTPFLILLLMIVSRNSLFDRWAWPPPLMVAVSASFTIAIISVLRLRRAAERARRVCLRNLNRELCKVQGASGTGEKESGDPASQIRTLIEEVQDIRRGAFAPLTERPVFRAMLMPFGGIGILALLEFVATL